MDLRLASEESREVETPPGPGEPEQGRHQVPAGGRHAYRPGYELTVCGIRLERLVVWPGLEWPGGPVQVEDLCFTCTMRAEHA